jgi:multiple sugar transport system substrate-binding protein
MYDPLYDAIDAFSREARMAVEVTAQLPHPELNAFVKHAFETGTALDVISTHTKYAPSQAMWLSPLDDLLSDEEIDDLLPRPAELSRIDGRLLQVPRNLDVRLLHYRRDLFEDPTLEAAYLAQTGQPLEVPATWSALIEVAAFLTGARHNDRAPFYGFLFPGRDSGLFGTFYELLVGAGGELFDSDLRPAFDSPAGLWAIERIVELHHIRRVTPRALATWHYDEISAAFREGDAALIADWPGSHHLYRDPTTCSVADRIGLALLPAGPAGVRAAYAGCHSFAVPQSARNREGAAALIRHLTSFEAQLGEARRGAIPCRTSALAEVRAEASTDPVSAERWKLLAETEKTMIVPPRFAAYPQCEDALWRAVQQAMLGALAPAEAIRRAAADVNDIIEVHAGTR